MGIYRAGPASVEAVKRGEVTLLHGTAIFFSAVNADKYFWMLDEKNPDTKILERKATQYIGKLILTERPLSNIEEDITSTYKQKEGTAEERRVYQFARSKLGKPRFRGRPSKQIDVSFQIRCIPKIMIGKTFKMTVYVENKSSKKRTINFMLSINSVYYTGKFADEVRRDRGTLHLQPLQKRELLFEVDPDEYVDKLVEFSMMRTYAHANVLETNQTWAAEDHFQFSRPRIQIEFEDETIQPKLLQPLKISFSFKNPLQVTLEDCFITIEGLGLIEFSKTVYGDLGPGEVLIHLETITPRRVGSHRIAAILSSRQLIAVLGSKKLNVEKV